MCPPQFASYLRLNLIAAWASPTSLLFELEPNLPFLTIWVFVVKVHFPPSRQAKLYLQPLTEFLPIEYQKKNISFLLAWKGRELCTLGEPVHSGSIKARSSKLRSQLLQIKIRLAHCREAHLESENSKGLQGKIWVLILAAEHACKAVECIRWSPCCCFSFTKSEILFYLNQALLLQMTFFLYFSPSK